MNRLIQCEVCRTRFGDNPNKHRYRSKLCPNCHTPYTHSGLKMPFHILSNIQEAIQKVFNFFPERRRKTILYVCPNRDCNFTANNEDEVRFEKYPDKTKEVMVDGKPQTVVLSYRDIVTCPKCTTHMQRKRKESA